MYQTLSNRLENEDYGALYRGFSHYLLVINFFCSGHEELYVTYPRESEIKNLLSLPNFYLLKYSVYQHI